jgi:hypothetical protein
MKVIKMKNIIPFLLIAILFFNTCKENEPTAPEEETPQEVLAEALIGPEGGTLETEDFKLTVPSGAFNQTGELSLYIEEKDSVNNNSVTPFYVIEGMPENYSAPLQLSLRYAGSTSGILYIEIGTEAEIIDFDTTYIDNIYELFDAVDESGYLKTTLPVVSTKSNFGNMGKSWGDKKKITLEGFINGVLESSEHFKIKSVDFPVSKWGQQYQTILEYFESSYNKMKSLGFELDRSDWPKIITIENKVVDLGNIRVYLSQNLKDLSILSHPGLDISGKMYYCEGFLCATILYAYKIDPQYENIIWGISSWTTHKYSDYWSSLSDAIWLKYALFRVLNNYENRTSLAMIMEYLIEHYGMNILNQIMLDVKAGNHPILAITANTSDPKMWLGDFHRSLFRNNLWLERVKIKDPNYSMVDFCNKYWSAEFGIEDTTTVIKWTETYKDLSAKLYRVNLLPGLNEESGLKFTVSGGDAEISLFKYKGTEIEFITSAEKTDSVGNIKNLADNGYQLIALVSNRMPDYPNFTTSSIELKIEHKNVKPLPKINSCAIILKDIEVNQILHYDSGDVQSSGFIYWSIYPMGEPTVTFENNIFQQSYYYAENNDSTQYSGNMIIEFSSDLDSILTFYVEDTYVHWDEYTVADVRTELSFSGFDIPLKPSWENDEYEVSGVETCSHLVDNMEYSRVAVGVTSWNLVDIKQCVDQSRLTIKITKE